MRTNSARHPGPRYLRSGTFIEGWAVYCDNDGGTGYGGPEVKMQQLKIRLRAIANAISIKEFTPGA